MQLKKLHKVPIIEVAIISRAKQNTSQFSDLYVSIAIKWTTLIVIAIN
jgi:hypothetical protein